MLNVGVWGGGVEASGKNDVDIVIVDGKYIRGGIHTRKSPGSLISDSIKKRHFHPGFLLIWIQLSGYTNLLTH
jgi:hypothetical protein